MSDFALLTVFVSAFVFANYVYLVLSRFRAARSERDRLSGPRRGPAYLQAGSEAVQSERYLPGGR